MNVRTASCRCGQLTVTCEGEPVRVSVCHCFACQKRSGSAFAVQARWPDERVEIEGAAKTWQRSTDSGNLVTYRFCPTCGSTMAYTIDGWPGVTAVPVGNFTDLDFPAPKHSVWENRKHHWVDILGEDVDRPTEASIQCKPGLNLRRKKD